MTDAQYKVWAVWRDAQQALCEALQACFAEPSPANYRERERLEKVVAECRKDCAAVGVPNF